MTQEQKAIVYDECLRESDALQRANSRMKSENAGNVSPELQKVIDKNNKRISELVAKLESLFE
jgi:hypothetical protein